MSDDVQFRHREQSSEMGRPARSEFRPVRFIMISLILLTAGAAGLHFKSYANPGTEPPAFSSNPPQYINVYVSTPVISVTVNVTLGQGWLNPNYGRYDSPVNLRPQGFTKFHEKVDITVKPAGPGAPVTMITSNIKPLTEGNSGPVLPLKSGPGRPTDISKAQRFAMPVSLSRYGPGNTWYGSVFFDSILVIFERNGSVFGHLPSVGAYDVLYPPTGCLEAGYDRRTGQLKDVTSDFFGPPLPATERTVGLGCPNNISSTEVIQHIVPALRNYLVDYTNPAVDSGNDADYVWHSAGIDGLEPAFKEASPEALDSQNQAAFYSGIAFGVAGSAFIAFIQEFPRSRKRKSSKDGTPSPA
jgi:hypothetical protein